MVVIRSAYFLYSVMQDQGTFYDIQKWLDEEGRYYVSAHNMNGKSCIMKIVERHTGKKHKIITTASYDHQAPSTTGYNAWMDERWRFDKQAILGKIQKIV